MSFKDKYLDFERSLSLFLKGSSIHCLRFAMGLIYFWFGMMKVFGISPVEELIHHATSWLQVHQFVIFLGVWEVLIGIFLWIKKWNRIGIILLLLQFPGTFLPLFLNPEDCFTVFPFGLTLEGQYIIKNFVLFAGTLILISDLHRNHS